MPHRYRQDSILPLMRFLLTIEFTRINPVLDKVPPGQILRAAPPLRWIICIFALVRVLLHVLVLVHLASL